MDQQDSTKKADSPPAGSAASGASRGAAKKVGAAGKSEAKRGLGKKEKCIALVLGGGAPNLTMMAGAVAALDEEGVQFDLISTSGAGMLIGLLYAAPKGMTRQEALRNSINMGVHDAIYNVFPVNYKVFHKPGPLAVAYTKYVPGRFGRFAERVLGPDHTPEQRDLLEGAFAELLDRGKALKEATSARESELEKETGKPAVNEGFGRLDALNRIGSCRARERDASLYFSPKDAAEIVGL